MIAANPLDSVSRTLPSDWEFLLGVALEAARSAAPIQRLHFDQDDLTVDRKPDESPVTIADRSSEEAIRDVLRRQTPDLGILGEEFGSEGSELDRWIIDPIDGTKSYIAGVPYYATLIGLMLDGLLVMGVIHAPSLPVEPRFAPPAAGGDSSLGRTWWGVLGHGAYTGFGTEREFVMKERLQVSRVDRLDRAFVCHGGLAHFRKYRWEPFVDLVDRCGRTRGFGDWWGHMLVAEGRCEAMVEPRVALHDLAAVKPIVEAAGGRFVVPDGELLVDSYAASSLSANAALAEEIARILEFRPSASRVR